MARDGAGRPALRERAKAVGSGRSPIGRCYGLSFNRKVCDYLSMRLWAALRRLLPFLAVVGLLFAPLAAPKAATQTGLASSAVADDMPCCPPQKTSVPDCAKTCPLMAICLTKCVRGSPVPAVLTVLGAPAKRIAPAAETRRNGLSHDPLSRPPIA